MSGLVNTPALPDERRLFLINGHSVDAQAYVSESFRNRH